MIGRSLNPINSKSFFLFGARGTGKSTFLRTLFADEGAEFIDLLDLGLQDEFTHDPMRFKARVLSAIEQEKTTIVVDEIQKMPRLLDSVHQLIESHKIQFALTGSSARRLKQKGTNLLAGRALVYELFPFTHRELGDSFDLDRALNRGTMPDSYLADSDDSSNEYLRSYALTYLEKEIQQEQWVRKLANFSRFLPVCAQMNGAVINRSAIARDVGVDDMTVALYFEILEDTLMGFRLPAFHRSVRKQQRLGHKFYLFDPGIKRALERSLKSVLVPGTTAYGNAFEHWLVLEIYRLSRYQRDDWQFSFMRTRDDVEIDLVVERPGAPLLLIEIKSKTKVSAGDAKSLELLGADLDKHAEKLLISQDVVGQRFGTTQALHWREALEKLF